MLHAKFHDHRSWRRRVLKVLVIYWYGSHLGHVTRTIFTKLVFPVPKEASHKIGL